jgi:hypothetical protein
VEVGILKMNKHQAIRRITTTTTTTTTTTNNNNNNNDNNSIYLCAKLNSPEANYKVSTGKKMGRIRSKKVSENNVLIKVKIIKYTMTMSTLLLS